MNNNTITIFLCREIYICTYTLTHTHTYILVIYMYIHIYFYPKTIAIHISTSNE